MLFLSIEDDLYLSRCYCRPFSGHSKCSNIRQWRHVHFVTSLAAVFKMVSVDRAVECVVSNSDTDELVNS